ncbi:hypothetical protein ACFE04_016799 [Oxalis oulophora]
MEKQDKNERKILLFKEMEAGEYSKLSMDNSRAAFIKSTGKGSNQREKLLKQIKVKVVMMGKAKVYKGESSHVVDTPSKKMKKDDATSADNCDTLDLEISDESDFQDKEDQISDTETEVVYEKVSEISPEKKKNFIPKIHVAQRTILKRKKVVGENYFPIVAENDIKERTFNHEMHPHTIMPSPTSIDVVVDDNKLMELMDIAMSSARKVLKFDDKNYYQKEILHLRAEVEILKERLKKKVAEVLSWELRNKK